MSSQTQVPQPNVTTQETHPIRREIAYCMDVLVPGVYLWLGQWGVRLGGCPAEDGYPGVLHSWGGVAIVLPGYQIWTTYRGDYDPR